MANIQLRKAGTEHFADVCCVNALIVFSWSGGSVANLLYTVQFNVK